MCRKKTTGREGGHTPAPPPFLPLIRSCLRGRAVKALAFATQRCRFRTPAPTFFPFFQGAPRVVAGLFEGCPRVVQGLSQGCLRVVRLSSSFCPVLWHATVIPHLPSFSASSTARAAAGGGRGGCCSRSGRCVDPLSHECVALKLNDLDFSHQLNIIDIILLLRN